MKKEIRFTIGTKGLRFTVCGAVWLLEFFGFKLGKVGNVWGRV